VIVVCAAYVVFGYRGFAGTASAYSPEASEVLWIVVGNLVYYGLGFALGIILKDNRAFCKYVCPISVIMKATSRFSLLKIEGDSASCQECRACTRVCPMSIDIPAYVKSDRRILSTECTLCQTCTTVCPKQTLHISLGFDAGRRECLVDEKALASTGIVR
jgi:polyferredoxin